jgi:hypothetical protein
VKKWTYSDSFEQLIVERLSVKWTGLEYSRVYTCSNNLTATALGAKFESTVSKYTASWYVALDFECYAKCGINTKTIASPHLGELSG